MLIDLNKNILSDLDIYQHLKLRKTMFLMLKSGSIYRKIIYCLKLPQLKLIINLKGRSFFPINFVTTWILKKNKTWLFIWHHCCCFSRKKGRKKLMSPPVCEFALKCRGKTQGRKKVTRVSQSRNNERSIWGKIITVMISLIRMSQTCKLSPFVFSVFAF